MEIKRKSTELPMPLAMPPVLAMTLGLIGSVAIVRWIQTEARRVNATLQAVRAGGDDQGGVATLKRDPVSGVYRPE
jgi:hypothetical protein